MAFLEEIALIFNSIEAGFVDRYGVVFWIRVTLRVHRECRYNNGRIVSMACQKPAHFMRWRCGFTCWDESKLNLFSPFWQGIGEALRYIHSLNVVHSNVPRPRSNKVVWKLHFSALQGKPREHFYQDWRRVSTCNSAVKWGLKSGSNCHLIKADFGYAVHMVDGMMTQP